MRMNILSACVFSVISGAALLFAVLEHKRANLEHKRANQLEAENFYLKQTGWDSAYKIEVTMEDFDRACLAKFGP